MCAEVYTHLNDPGIFLVVSLLLVFLPPPGHNCCLGAGLKIAYVRSKFCLTHSMIHSKKTNERAAVTCHHHLSDFDSMKHDPRS